MKTNIIPAPKGFKAGGIRCGIKKHRKDLALIYSEVPAAAAGMFTTNKVFSASVKISKNITSGGTIQAIIANSGNANALTGFAGEQHALEMARAAACSLNIDVSKVAVASTGVIGKPLPIYKILEGIDNLVKRASSSSFFDAAQAILTTDTKVKYVSKQLQIDNKTITITAIAKGAGMIHPNMATMLCFITTDLKISQSLLQEILRASVDMSFNCISVDGCTSTNDTVIAMANGLSGNNLIDTRGDNFNTIQKEFNDITIELAKMIIYDGEGTTKLVEIEVNGAPSYEYAKKIAFSIANYNLLKCSFFGETLSAGRIMAAIGASFLDISPEDIDVYIGDEIIVQKGLITAFDGNKIISLLKQLNINMRVNLKKGEHKAIVWTSDLSPKYVKINME